ncbi:MAG: hypothetical protein JWO22_2725 [Frankiales bacterium]|nr:hypothetical protein [Frankiales bacterium]
MTLLEERPALTPAPVVRPHRTTSWLVVAGLSSLGGGAIHFAAAGVHGDHKQAVYVFTALAIAQVGWGCVAMVRRDALTAYAGVAVGLAAAVGWAIAKSVGLPFVDGLQTPEALQVSDVSAAVLAALGTVCAAAATGRSRGLAVPVWAVALPLALATGVGTVSTSNHTHAGVAGHTHAGVHATPYDPTLPIDLSGTPGVTPQQQAAAENLVAITVARLPQWADAEYAEKHGFRSIGDGFTGTEHLVNQAFLHDSHVLDPDHPESLVYDTSKGGRTLVAAMYMVAPGTDLADVPDVGGALVQWHIHDNLCYSPSGYVQGITDAAGNCPAGQVKPIPTPMVHVWIVKNQCGPFAALEGIGGGSIAKGQTRLCDHLHGSTA